MTLFYFLLLPLIVTFIAPLLTPKKATYLSSLAFILPFLSIVYHVFSGTRSEFPLTEFTPPIGDIYLNFDVISHAFGLTICIVSAMVAIFALPYMKHRIEEMELDMTNEFRRYIFLYNLYAASMLWLVYSGNLILLYIFLEISLISAFLLIYFYGYGNRRWVGMLYFTWMLVAGVLTLVGFLIIAFDNYTLALRGIKVVSMLSWIFIFIGMIIELPVVGFHIWLPWAHAEAPTPVSALLSPLAVGLAGYILLRIYLIDPSFIVAYRVPILVYAMISSIYAGFSVFWQTDYKRLLAYSTVSQMGYMLIGLCLGSYGLMGAVIQYMSHAFGKSILFTTAGGIIAVYGLRDIRKMGGLHDYVPQISNAAVIGFMNLGGILTVGMFGEFFILRGVVDTFGLNPGVILPVVFIFILSVWYGFYALRRIFYGRPNSSREKKRVNRGLYIPLFIIGFFSVLFLLPPLSTVLVSGLRSIMMGVGGVVP